MSTTEAKPPAAGPGAPPPPPAVTARITLRVTESATGGISGHEMQLTNPGPTVDQPDADTIRVRNGGAKLEISILPAVFRPVDILFVDKATGETVPIDGGGPFRNKHARPNTLEIDDTFPMPPEGQTPAPKRYKFSVVVDRVTGGRVGIIDPEVENEN